MGWLTLQPGCNLREPLDVRGGITAGGRDETQLWPRFLCETQAVVDQRSIVAVAAESSHRDDMTLIRHEPLRDVQIFIETGRASGRTRG